MINLKQRLSRLIVAGLALLAAAGLAGCSHPEDEMPPPKVEPVKAYGMSLDASATPQQVTYVLLRSLADDVHAAQAHPAQRQEQKKANRITWSVAAPGVIAARIEEIHAQARTPGLAKLTGKERDRAIYAVVNQWAPIVAYYVDSFDKDPAPAIARMRLLPGTGPGDVHVHYEVWPEASRSDADRHQTLDVELVKEKGADGKEYWRVVRVGYTLPPSHASRPAGTAATKPATRPG